MGVDSLMALELRDRLSRRLGRPLPATLPYDYPTIESLADRLACWAEPMPPAPPQEQDKLATLLADLESLSEEEAQARLAMIRRQGH